MIILDHPDSGDDPHRGPGFLIREVWAYVAVDSTGAEGVIAINGIVAGVPMMLPLLLTDRRHLDNRQLREKAIAAARKDRKTVRLIKLTTREVIETLYEPPGGPR